MASVAIPTKKPKDLPDQNLTQKVELQRLQAEGGQLIPPAIVPPEILPEGVDEPKSILGSEAGGSGFEREMKTKTGSGSPTDDMSRTHNYVHKYEPGKPKTKANLLPGYPKWVEKT